MTRYSASLRATARHACAAIALAAALTAGIVRAYVLEGPKWASSPTFQLSLGNPGYALSDGNTSWNNAVAPALTMWNQVIGRIQLGKVTASSIPVVSGDGYNSLAFSTTVFGQSFGSNTLAVTYYSYSSSSFNEADTLFNKAKRWDSYRGALRFDSTGVVIADIQRVALHELGHGIGLDHPDDAGQHVDAVMNAKISNRYTLGSDDINGAHALYGAPVTSPPPATGPTQYIYWQNRFTGDRSVWVMNGTSHSSTVSLGRVALGWNIVACGDFNGDGRQDLLWQNAATGQCTVWVMNGTTRTGTLSFPSVPAPWQIATASDFNGDAKPDVVLQNPSTGQRVIWYMNRTTFVSSANLGFVDARYDIVGSGDFNGDHKSDLNWQSLALGQSRLWLMSGRTIISNVAFPNAGAGWQNAGTGDFNGDGKRDVIWQNQSTGQRAIWLMNGSTIMNRTKLCVFAVIAAAAALTSARATTVVAPTFEQLVGQAEIIFEGTVSDVKSMWAGEGGQRHIQSYITFKVADAIKGQPGATYTISMLGGTVDGETLEVTDTPKFKVGDRDILFVEHNGQQFVPLVGINFGRFHVRHDAQSGRDVVHTGDDEPLVEVTQLGRGEQVAAAARTLSPDEFKAAIKSQLARAAAH